MFFELGDWSVRYKIAGSAHLSYELHDAGRGGIDGQAGRCPIEIPPRPAWREINKQWLFSYPSRIYVFFCDDDFCSSNL